MAVAVELAKADDVSASEARAPPSLESAAAAPAAESVPSADDTAEPPIMGHPVDRRH